MSMNFIDIASYQAGINLEELFQRNPSLDGVIVKATEGTYYTNPNCDGWVQTLIKLGKPFGVYHYLSGGDPIAEADFFLKHISDYIGKGVPCADYEGEALRAGTGYVKRFIDRVYERTGVRPFVYCSLSVVHSQDFSAIANDGYQLWLAQYANYNPVDGFLDRPWQSGSVAPFTKYVMHQYTSNGHLNGWAKGLDFDKYSGSFAEWLETARGETSPAHHEVDPTVIAELLAGRFGIEGERVRALREAGYDPDEVQAKVNELYAIAAKVKPIVSDNMAYLNSIIKIVRA